ncbi:unnamed protein product [Rotaria magnacalcarata]|uniref:Spliceosome-associated protein CWC27 homolog n=9 Tax=Rotaria TaxID=231623 RepID=A0A816B024_9BILA|nr:unnamed protein product [Rotaria magnacalcarata]CAF1602994.1 unnamed protein product [Rotaria magnacalcarata]CAF2105903.1 unnamed protein product [Rotaria magnacalcarata]CAF2120940.1 unnamed protein product [Rotaria magnacalcarata]
MSNIYIQEPATRGKVILDTTVGDIEIELFSKECPLACRNFLQLCMNGYYDGTVFHRVVPNFIAQGGDPTGTGEGGESATGAAFADEFHTRLRFNRRGLLGMANHGPNTNDSQFFFTLGSTPELDKKNTLFGKIVGNTLFNMLKLGEGEIIGETPVRAHKIIKTEVISNPFDDMEARPRAKPQGLDDHETNKKSKDTFYAKAIKNYGLLSFGNEAEEDEEEITKVSIALKQKGTGKSAHDLTNDATLSKTTVRLDDDDEQSDEELPIEKEHPKVAEKSDANFDKEELDRVRRKFNEKKLTKVDKKKPVKLDAEDDEHDDEKDISSSKPDDVKLEIERLKKELKQSKKASTSTKQSEESVPEETEPVSAPAPIVSAAASTSALMDELMAGTRRNTRKNHVSHSNSRESQTLDLLSKFRAKLHAVKDDPASEPVNETPGEQKNDKVPEDFLKHRFVSDELLDNVQDIYTNADLLSVYDPRNPMTKRRRDESSMLLQQKKHKGRS